MGCTRERSKCLCLVQASMQCPGFAAVQSTRLFELVLSMASSTLCMHASHTCEASCRPSASCAGAGALRSYPARGRAVAAAGRSIFRSSARRAVELVLGAGRRGRPGAAAAQGQ